MFLHPHNYRLANEILYALYSCREEGVEEVSKIGLQKLLYLSKVLAPVKDIILETIKFLSYIRGPYSKDIQNITDQLVAIGLANITEFKTTRGRNTISYYKITEGGEQVIEKLTKYSKEEEKLWWIGVIVKCATIYSKESFLNEDHEFSDLDKIVRLVYQEPTFLEIRSKENTTQRFNSTLIDYEDYNNPTQELIKFTKQYIKKHQLYNQEERLTAEFVLVAFFEFLCSSYLNSEV